MKSLSTSFFGGLGGRGVIPNPLLFVLFLGRAFPKEPLNLFPLAVRLSPLPHLTDGNCSRMPATETELGEASNWRAESDPPTKHDLTAPTLVAVVVITAACIAAAMAAPAAALPNRSVGLSTANPVLLPWHAALQGRFCSLARSLAQRLNPSRGLLCCAVL